MADAETPGLKVVTTVRRRGYRAYALGAYRGEVYGCTQRWRWRVWAAVGGTTLAMGRADYVAEAEAVVAMQLRLRMTRSP